MGMIGGGHGSFVGGVHRLAAALDGQIELVAGVFSRDWGNTKATGAQLYLAEDVCMGRSRRWRRPRRSSHRSAASTS